MVREGVINMNRKILMSTFSIVAAMTLMGGAAFAAFTTSATASSSTFSTGTDNLLVSSDNVDVDFASSISSPFHDVKVSPGYNHQFNFFLKNDNTNSTDNLAVTATFNGGGGDSGLESLLTTQFSCNDPITGVTNASSFSVTSMRGGSVSLGTVSSGQVASCTLTVSLPASADNSVAGKNSTFNVEFDGTQTP